MSDSERLFIRPLAIGLSSWEKHVFRSSARFLIQLPVFVLFQTVFSDYLREGNTPVSVHFLFLFLVKKKKIPIIQ